jgi:recombination protein RecR
LAEKDPCSICTGENRDKTLLSIVADERDLFVIEDTNIYNGLYFVLGGTINSIEQVGPDDINIKGLVKRIKDLKPKEIILALNPTLDGETTSLYLAKLIKPSGIKVTRLAKGLPSGANIEYADGLTIGNALKFRNEV